MVNAVISVERKSLIAAALNEHEEMYGGSHVMP